MLIQSLRQGEIHFLFLFKQSDVLDLVLLNFKPDFVLKLSEELLKLSVGILVEQVGVVLHEDVLQEFGSVTLLNQLVHCFSVGFDNRSGLEYFFAGQRGHEPPVHWQLVKTLDPGGKVLESLHVLVHSELGLRLHFFYSVVQHFEQFGVRPFKFVEVLGHNDGRILDPVLCRLKHQVPLPVKLNFKQAVPAHLFDCPL